MGKTKNFFVYGTLKSGECRGDVFRQVLGYEVERRKGCIYAKLYDLGAYPAAVCEGNNSIYGEMVVLLEEDYYKMLPVLDGIEGYVSGREDNLYIRKEVEVIDPLCEMPDHDVATTYFFADSKELKNYGKRLEGGLWFTQKENI